MTDPAPNVITAQCSVCGDYITVPQVIQPDPDYQWIPVIGLGSDAVRQHWAAHYAEPPEPTPTPDEAARIAAVAAAFDRYFGRPSQS